MPHPAPTSGADRAPFNPRWLPWVAVPALLLLTAILAVTSLLGDSVTYDETSHLTAGMSVLQTGDFRLAPDHPPLAKLWCAWPLRFMDTQWPPADNKYWLAANVFAFGRVWLFELNDGQRLMTIGRCMMVILLLATCATTYALARRLFGPGAGLLALALAALSPTLLAHGRLVTTDLPITLVTALTLLTFDRLMEHNTWARLLLAAAALAAASVTKMSWPLVLPALVVMAIVAIVRRVPADKRTRRARAGAAFGSLGFMAFVTWLGIWTCYGWRSAVIAPVVPTGNVAATQAQVNQANEALALQWHRVVLNPDGTPRRGWLRAFLRFAADHGLLPDAYLLGLAQTLEATSQRYAYLMGDYSTTGWRSYFPIAFALKTPLPTIALIVIGVATLVRFRLRSRAPTLVAGVLTFVIIYGLYAVFGHLNIGHRHLLPLYPLLFALASATTLSAASPLRERTSGSNPLPPGERAAGRSESGTSSQRPAAPLNPSDLARARIGWGLIGFALLWLLIANLQIYPHYLAYFNELIGGPAHASAYLADSNLDWGQDLLRLADYARAHPDEQVKLAYFGSAVPTRYLSCTALPSYMDFTPRADLSPGTYVVSITQLLGVYDPEIRPGFWNDVTRTAYARLGELAAAGTDAAQRAEAQREYGDLRAKRLISRLRERPPDARVGYSLFIYQLDTDHIARLTEP